MEYDITQIIEMIAKAMEIGMLPGLILSLCEWCATFIGKAITGKLWRNHDGY